MKEVEGKCIAFANHKGGSGKTTSCVNIAGELARQGKKVLVIDLDPQGNATSGLGINKSKIELCMYDVLHGRLSDESDDSIKDIILNTKIENLDIAPATLELSGILTKIHDAENPVSILDEEISEVKNEYDYILIDSPPGYGYLLINAIYASDSLVIPLDTGAFTIDSIKSFTTLLKDIQKELKSEIHIHGVTLTVPQEATHYKLSRFLSSIIPSYKHISSDTEDKIKLYLSVNNLFMDKLYIIPYSRKIYEAQSNGMPLSHYDPYNEINDIYRELALKLL